MTKNYMTKYKKKGRPIINIYQYGSPWTQRIVRDLLGADELWMKLGFEVGGKKYSAAICSGESEQIPSGQPLALLKELVSEPSEIPGTEYPFQLTSITLPYIEGVLVGEDPIEVMGSLAEYPITKYPVEEPKTPLSVKENGISGKAKVKARITYAYGSRRNVHFNLSSRINGNNEKYEGLTPQEIYDRLKGPLYKGCNLDVSGLSEGWAKHFKSVVR